MVDYKQRRFIIKTYCGNAIHALRELEDYARLEINDEVLADRARECHEEITTRILRGRKGVGLSRKQLEQALEYFEPKLQ